MISEVYDVDISREVVGMCVGSKVNVLFISKMIFLIIKKFAD